MVVNKLIDTIQELGFSEYEARAYVGALRLHAATPYEIARESGIPSSKIYEIIAKLMDRGLLFEVPDDHKKKYAALESPEFLARQKDLFDKRTRHLTLGFQNLGEKRDVSFVWNITEYDRFLEKSRRMIDNAENTLLVSVWPEEYAAVFDRMDAAQKRGVQIAIIHYGKPQDTVGTVFPHPIKDTLYNEKGGRGFSLVADSRTALTATVFKDNSVEGAWSTNRGFVTLAEDYLKHDIYIMKIVRRFDQELVGRFGENYMFLREIYSDKEVAR